MASITMDSRHRGVIGLPDIRSSPCSRLYVFRNAVVAVKEDMNHDVLLNVKD